MSSSTPFNLSRQRRRELKSAFDLFDKKKTGALQLSEMEYLLKSMGARISSRDQNALRREFADRGEFTWEDFLLIGQEVYNDKAIERSLLKALRELAPPGSEKISVKVLRESLLRLGLGIKLTEEEVDLFLQFDCEPDDRGEIDFETFIYRVLRE